MNQGSNCARAARRSGFDVAYIPVGTTSGPAATTTSKWTSFNGSGTSSMKAAGGHTSMSASASREAGTVR